jgi:hypothetical protein
MLKPLDYALQLIIFIRYLLYSSTHISYDYFSFILLLYAIKKVGTLLNRTFILNVYFICVIMSELFLNKKTTFTLKMASYIFRNVD